MKSNIYFKISVLTIFLVFSYGCASTTTKETSLNIEDKGMITDLQIHDNSLSIVGNRHFTYTIYSSSDPYRSIIEISDMTADNIPKKIISDKPGITEVNLDQKDSKSRSMKIEVVMQTPSALVPVYKDNILTLSVKKEEPVPVEATENREPENLVTANTVLTSQAIPAIEEKTVEKDSAHQETTLPVISKATEINNIEISKTAEGAKVFIRGNGTMIPNVFPINDRIVIDIPDVVLKTDMPATVVYPLKGIRVGKHKEKIRLVIDLKEKSNFDVAAVGNIIEISVLKKESVAAAQSVVASSEKPSSVSPSSVVPQVEPAKDVKKTEEGAYTGKKISLDFQDADIVPIFRLLADISGYNIVVSPDIKGKITLKLINVPWDQALDIILRTFSLAKLVDGNVMRIVPSAVVTKELEEIAKTKKAQAEAGDLKTKLFPINYIDLAKIRDAIDKAKVLSSRGTITLDERGSQLIVNDLEPNLQKLGELIMELDKEHLQARQVMIEARIVEVTSNYSKDLGIQWGVFYKNPRLRSAPGDTLTVGASGRSSTGLPGDFLVNLPAASSLGRIGFGYINSAATLALDLQLTAMEELKQGKIISNPRVLTMNNQEAKIDQGTTLYLQSTAAGSNVASFTAVDATLSLTVKPRIAPGGAIFMDLKVTKDEPTSIPTAPGGSAEVAKNTVQTSVLIHDGETVVIGGVYKKSETGTEQSVPGLSKLPIIGPLLFKKDNKLVVDSELLIFITPRIVELNHMK